MLIYNKYKNSSYQPLRSYSYTNEKEFVADAYSWYYFLYINPSQQPYMIKQNLYYPNDLKQAAKLRETLKLLKLNIHI